MANRTLAVLYAVLLVVWISVANWDARMVAGGSVVLLVLWAMGAAWTNGNGPSRAATSTLFVRQSLSPSQLKRLRSRFVAALGHDLGNPLNSITGFSDMLLSGAEGQLNNEQERSVRTIRASAEELSRLMASIVNEAKLDLGTLRLHEQWVTPQEIAKETVRHLRVRAYGQDISIDATESLPRIFVDRTQTIHALVSLGMLLFESVGTSLVIKLAPPRWEKAKALQVDLIANVDPEALDSLNVVERLQQEAASSDPLGLEVFVARRIIEVQGGRLWTETGTAGRLRVCLTLPAGNTGRLKHGRANQAEARRTET